MNKEIKDNKPKEKEYYVSIDGCSCGISLEEIEEKDIDALLHLKKHKSSK